MTEVNKETINKYLVFEVDETYAVELKGVVEILEMQPVTSVPETPSYIKGVINLRGRVVPVVDVRDRFKKAAIDESSRKCIIIVNFEGIILGLIVDSVVDLITIEPDKISEPPTVGGSYAHIFIKAIGIYEEEMKLIIDENKIINHSDLDFLNAEE